MALVSRLPQRRAERLMFSSSDDNAMLKQIQSTHAPDGREVEVTHLLRVIEEIFQHAKPIIHAPGANQVAHPRVDMLDDTDLREMLELLSYTINKISCEMACKCIGGGDAHGTTLNIFNILSNYTWDAKVVIALAAFSINYGEFWMLAQLYPTNYLAKAVATLKQLPETLEHVDTLKPRFEVLTGLIKAMVDLTKCIIEFKQLPPQYISPDAPELLTATTHIPTAAYWIIRSIVACASQITNLISMGHEYATSTAEAWELSSLAHKINSIYTHLSKQLDLCDQLINEKKHLEAFEKLVHLFATPHLDNMKILQALIYAKDDQLPLLDGSTKRRVGLDVLRRRNVLLLISDIDLPNEELLVLEQMYQEAKQAPTRMESQYEVVWIPVVGRSTPWDSEKQKQFETLQGMMTWYSVVDPTLIDPAVIKYIKEVWKFNKKAMLVVLDPQGRVANPNAIHMMLIWGSLAYPFTSDREEVLWKEEKWRIELLASPIEPMIFNWITEGKYVCLYGGEDIEWIRKFTNTARAVARAAQIPLEMLYVGKSNPREKVRKNSATILAENLSHVLPDLTLIWFFWVRLESMWHSKVQQGKSVDSDPIMQEIMKMLSFDGSDQGWAVICRGTDTAKAKGDVILAALADYESWKGRIGQRGFLPALNDRLQDLQTPHHCNRLILPSTTGTIPERVVCAECGRVMEKFIMYRCCTD
ncbi:protein SIEVE ELEMENT OCCLUSION B-like [Rhodamnia argentea]|uniref:Protein SIEVE ELEMENT OCCLUSION B-like n=1 Tax=Rhodamnia argentea TaxID=178133 RepID=A0A8B8Q4P8_9MYRT|nr:protein SIEVE ELEMENT OCCLUSION B-like [Rhodamnia argentea]XP_030542065.1 protein SIEVE ELEMENT OCCLUSION B-like [Rhodamnia argentea]